MFEAVITIIAGSGLLGLQLLRRFASHLRRRRPVRSSLHGVGGVSCFAAAAVLLALLGNFQAYQRLTGEQALAQLHFTLLDPQHYRATLRYPSGMQQSFEVRGDEWQLDARILKWRGYATVAGFDTLFRPERLSGRYSDISQERGAARSVYALSLPPRLDLWTLARRHGGWLPWLDAQYGSATFLPMADNAQYAVTVGASGLLTRPLNQAARTAIERWR